MVATSGWQYNSELLIQGKPTDSRKVTSANNLFLLGMRLSALTQPMGEQEFPCFILWRKTISKELLPVEKRAFNFGGNSPRFGAWGCSFHCTSKCASLVFSVRSHTRKGRRWDGFPFLFSKMITVCRSQLVHFVSRWGKTEGDEWSSRKYS